MKRQTLHQLQDSFDDEAAHRRAADLRHHIAPTIAADLRWMPLVLTLGTLLTIAAAALSRGMTP